MSRATASSYLDQLGGLRQPGRVTTPSNVRSKALLKALGNPHHAFPAVHVTGTNGKSSTSTMTAALLSAAGLRVGLYTSPHLFDCGERIRIDGQPTSESQLNAVLASVREAAGGLQFTPSWFEALTAAGFLRFADAKVDVAVVEVGMLGRWDATNVLDAATAIVTNVELDHTEFAGNTRAGIALEKAGIVRRGATLVLGERDPELRSIFFGRRPARTFVIDEDVEVTSRRRSRRGQTVDLRLVDRTVRDVHVPALGRHQTSNALLALCAAESHLATRLGRRVIARAMYGLHLPGRLQIIGNRAVVVDVAHNPAGAAAVKAAVDGAFGVVRRRVLVAGMLAGRDPAAFLDALGAPAAHMVVATEPASDRVLPAVALARAARSIGASSVSEADPHRALRAALEFAGRDGVVVVAGSHQLAGPLLARGHQ